MNDNNHLVTLQLRRHTATLSPITEPTPSEDKAHSLAPNRSGIQLTSICEMQCKLYGRGPKDPIKGPSNPLREVDRVYVHIELAGIENK